MIMAISQRYSHLSSRCLAILSRQESRSSACTIRRKSSLVLRNHSFFRSRRPVLAISQQASPALSTASFTVAPSDAGHSSIQPRTFSSQSGGSNFKLDALPFTISPEQAVEKFEKWAMDEQGLNYLLRWSSVRISASYVPVWSFDTNLRFKVDTSYKWKPSMFEQAYPNQSTIFISGLSAYSGHTYRRTLINPIHNTTLVFIGDETQPFGNWMLHDMVMSDGERLEIFPDPWNATKAQALDVLRQDLTTIAQSENKKAEVKMQVVSARRVYMPTYIVEYSILGLEYQAFLSGCDDGGGVAGANHQVWGNSATAGMPSSQSFLEGLSSAAQVGLRTVGSRGIATILTISLQFLGSIAARVAMRLPPIAVLGSIFIGARKVIYPWLDHRYASAEWERQREREATGGNYAPPTDDFDDVRRNAKRYFSQNKARILQSLSGENDHQNGDYDWYKDWENWARQQYEQQSQQQQQQQQQGYSNQQQNRRQQQQQSSGGRQRQRQRAKPKKEHTFEFDPNDPYSVLGLRRGASKSDVSAAFRREMLKHHPDVQAGASDAAKERSQERSKYITEAYRKIKTEMKN